MIGKARKARNLEDSFPSHFTKIKRFNVLSKSIQTEIKYIKQIKQE